MVDISHNEDDILVSGDKNTRLTAEMAIDLARDLVAQAEELESREHVLFLDMDNTDDRAELEVALGFIINRLQRNNAPLNYAELRETILLVEKWNSLQPPTTTEKGAHDGSSGNDGSIPDGSAGEPEGSGGEDQK